MPLALYHARSAIDIAAWRVLMRTEGKDIAVKVRIFPASKLRSAGKFKLLAFRIHDKGSFPRLAGLNNG